MIIKAKTIDSDLATVFIAEFDKGRIAEFVESCQPPNPRSEKWVLIISTLFGCPVKCKICDAGSNYYGKMSVKDMLDQIEYAVRFRFPNGKPETNRFKIQFSRMGEPAFNTNVIDALVELKKIYHVSNIIPSLSTIAPLNCDKFFERLIDVKKEYYDDCFQLQFSMHSTDKKERDFLVPAKKWTFRQIADYGDRFYTNNGKKITLNFAFNGMSDVNPDVISIYFNPDKFIIKITPINPTINAKENGLEESNTSLQETDNLIESFQNVGFQVIYSIGEYEENLIGSNCGQYISYFKDSDKKSDNSYLYDLEIY